MKKGIFLVLILHIYAYSTSFAQCSESNNAYKGLSTTVNISDEISCDNGDVDLDEVGSNPAGDGEIILDQTVTWNSFIVHFQNGNKPAKFIIPAGVTITITGDFTFEGTNVTKDKFLEVQGALIVGGTLDFGDLEFEIDGTGTIDAGEITGGDNSTCTDVADGGSGTGTCPTITAPVCGDVGGICTEPGTVTPIELFYFAGNESKETVLLNWATASEENFDYFEIERATEGASFDFIGEVKGNGNSFKRLDYSFTDVSPEIGLNYYRLKSIDLDGTFEYSDVILVRFTSNVKLLVSPNPTLGVVSIKTSLPTTGSLNYEITNQYGVVVLKGNLAEYNTQIDLQGLTKGIYIIRLIDLPSVKAKRIILK